MGDVTSWLTGPGRNWCRSLSTMVIALPDRDVGRTITEMIARETSAAKARGTGQQYQALAVQRCHNARISYRERQDLECSGLEGGSGSRHGSAILLAKQELFVTPRKQPRGFRPSWMHIAWRVTRPWRQALRPLHVHATFQSLSGRSYGSERLGTMALYGWQWHPHRRREQPRQRRSWKFEQPYIVHRPSSLWAFNPVRITEALATLSRILHFVHHGFH
jgi:hypothetical protein